MALQNVDLTNLARIGFLFSVFLGFNVLPTKAADEKENIDKQRLIEVANAHMLERGSNLDNYEKPIVSCDAKGVERAIDHHLKLIGEKQAAELRAQPLCMVSYVIKRDRLGGYFILFLTKGENPQVVYGVGQK